MSGKLTRIRRGTHALFFDLSESKPKGRKKSDRMRALGAMLPGKGNALVLDHSEYGTPFAVWIAQARMRTHKNFQYERVRDGVELYKVWVPVNHSEHVSHVKEREAVLV